MSFYCAASGQCSTEQRTTDTRLSIPILDPKLTPGVYPGNRSIDADDHAGPTLQAASKFDLHLSALFVQFIKVGWAGVDTESLAASLALFLVEGDVVLRIVLKRINGQFFFNFHLDLPQIPHILYSPEGQKALSKFLICDRGKLLFRVFVYRHQPLEKVTDGLGVKRE